MATEETLNDIIERVLEDHDVAAEDMLAAMVEALVERHVDVELRRLGRREPYPIHNERVDALKAVNDALHQKHARAAKDVEAEPVVRAVIAVLMAGQFAAERAAGINDDDGDNDDDDGGGGGPHMRLVRD